MNPELGMTDEPRHWSPYQWWSVVAAVLVIQLGLIFWLGDQGPVPPLSATPGLALQMAAAFPNELLALTDPTLLALPHREAFAGQAWLGVPTVGYRPFEWSEPPHWLNLPVEHLGAAFHSFLTTNQFAPPETFARHEPDLLFPDNGNLPENAPASTPRVLGDLAYRALLTPLNPCSWTNSEILTNTIVQLLVDPDGRPYFASLLWKSGSPEADRFALKQAWGARFAAAPRSGERRANPVADLSWGQIVFDWQTLPLAPTNHPAGP